MRDDMQDNMQDNGVKRTPGRTIHARVLLLLATVACVLLLASECSKSRVEETVTVAPRSTATRPQATTSIKSSYPPPTVDAETEAAGDALAHAIVALKTKRRGEFFPP